MKIAVIEDHAVLSNQYCGWLKKAFPQAVIEQYFTRDDAEAAIDTRSFKLVILDVILGSERNAGVALISALQRRMPSTPVLVVSSHPASIYRNIMTELNAWDYLQKTKFEEEEFIDVVLQIVRETKRQPVQAGDDLTFDLVNGVRWKGRKMNLPGTASKFLAYIYQHRGRIVTYRELGEITKTSRSKDTVKQHITHITSAFRELGEPNPVKNEDMVGYYWLQMHG